VAAFEEAMEKIHWYTCRWHIELFFKILKSGCKIEPVQLETAARLRRCLAVYAVVAWRVMFLTMQSRALPDLPATCCWNWRNGRPGIVITMAPSNRRPSRRL
jgi:hypothetical protein